MMHPLAATEEEAADLHRGHDRAQFWTEFREGQRDADRKCLEAAARAYRNP
jgi:hypothetical protein